MKNSEAQNALVDKDPYTGSYIGDLAGVVSVIERGTGQITPLAAWNLETHRVDGHPALSPDGNWILYDCNIDGGSEVRAVRIEGE